MIHDHIETIAANSFRNFHAKGLDELGTSDFALEPGALEE